MATVRDVARRAGVSISTVSRALAQPELVSAATRESVIEAAKALGYEPNAAARGLRSGVSMTLGLVIPEMENPYFASIAKGVQATARTAGYSVLMVDTEGDPQLEQELISKLSRDVDGLILAAPRGDETFLLKVLDHKPGVLINREVLGKPALLVDNAGGIRQILDHLAALGHTKIAYASGPGESWSATQRTQAFSDISKEMNVDAFLLGKHSPSVAQGNKLADLALNAGVTALVCYNDLLALGALQRLFERGVKTPQEMSVVGFDDSQYAEISQPTLTSVHIPLRDIGARACQAVIDSLRGNPMHDNLTIPVELAIRNSTAQVIR